MNKKTLTLLYITLIVVMIATVFFLIWFVKSEAKECLANPFVYGARQLKNIECNCFQYLDDLPCPNKFFFNMTTLIGKSGCS